LGDYPHDYTKLPSSFFFDCQNTQGQREVVQVNPDDSWLSLDFISAAGFDTLSISIDEHPLWVYSVDGRFVVPYQAHTVVLDPGARYSVMVKLDKPRGRQYTIRVNNILVNQMLTGSAILSYSSLDGTVSPQPSVPYIDRFGYTVSPDLVTFQGVEAPPFPAVTPSTNVNKTFVLDVGRWGTSYSWTVNGKAAYPSEAAGNQEPLLFYPHLAHPNHTISTLNNTWVDLVFRATPFNPTHPIHKHSNKAFVIGRGEGHFNYATVAEAIAAMPQNFNLRNPLLRDTWVPPAAITGPTWTVVRYHVVNPGPSLLHCHMQPHLEGGMALVIMDGLDAWPQAPPEYLNGNGIKSTDDLSLYANP
jgi:FtsP/CotA-like multicopper oxidase with cupredoxin domain